MNYFKEICCPRCRSKNVEAHFIDKTYTTVSYLCINCLLAFNNYDFLINWKFREKLLNIKTNECTVDEIIDYSLKLLKRNGVQKYLDKYQIEELIYTGFDKFDCLKNLCFVEIMTDHWNNIAKEHNKNENSV